MKDSAPTRHKLGDPIRELHLDSERATRFESMFDRHAQRVYAYAARRSSPDVANEVVAETFLIAWRKLDAVPAEPLPWLLNVAGKVLANRRRSSQRRDAFTASLAGTLRAVPAFDPTDAVPTRMAIQEALDRLPPAEREALTLVAWDGLDVRSGAAAAGCSRATFSVRLHRARRRMMKELGLWRHSQANARSGRTVPAEEAKPT
jgi:RNA polymerase sigma-70 factor (ECF subfamily)